MLLISLSCEVVIEDGASAKLQNHFA